MSFAIGRRCRRIVAACLAALFLLGGPALAAPQSEEKPVLAPQGTVFKAGTDETALAEIYQYLTQMTPAELAATLKLFRVRELINKGHVDPAAGRDLMTGAVRGAVAASGDPYTDYFDAKTLKDFLESAEGVFSGVGLVLGMRDKQITVIAPIEGTPADAAGIVSGDRVIAIDGQSTKDMPLDQAVGMIRGPEGVPVTLTIARAGENSRDYIIVRAVIQIKSVFAKMLDGDIGYVRLTYFNKHTGEDLDAALRGLKNQGMKAVILDLRNNPGGLISASVKVASHFIPKGPVVSVVTRDGKRRTEYTEADNLGLPLVVLINGGSASASEIVAGAIQDTKSGTLVGTRSFGKGSVQNLIPLDKDTALKLTIARYHTPADRIIDGTGIEPDIFVTLPLDYRESGRDLQLDKALEIIKEKMAQ
jgi:carboxyl-terminal processing protease